MTVRITPFPGGTLSVDGVYSKGEADTGLNESFEIAYIETDVADLTELLEWASTKRDILRVIEELCLENIH